MEAKKLSSILKIIKEEKDNGRVCIDSKYLKKIGLEDETYR